MNQWYGYINFDEEIVLKNDNWSVLGAFCDSGFASVILKSSITDSEIINEDGETVLNTGTFSYVYGLSKEGYSIVKNSENLYGIIDSSGNFIIEPTFLAIECLPYNNLVFASEDGEKFGIIDITTEEWITEQKFDDIITDFTEYGFCLVKVDEKYGIIDENGDYVVEPNYTGYTTFEDGYWYLSNDEERILVTETGEIGATTKY